MLIGYNVTMEMTGTDPMDRVLGVMQVTLIGYNITIETAEPGAISCNHSSYYPGKKGVKKLICQQLQGHAAATNSVLVCVSTNRSTNITWNHCEDGICKIAREDARKTFPCTLC